MIISKSDIDDVVTQETKVKRESLTDDATLTNLEIDSLDMVSIIFALEDKFGLNMETEDIKNISTYRQFVDLVIAKAA